MRAIERHLYWAEVLRPMADVSERACYRDGSPGAEAVPNYNWRPDCRL